MLALREHLDVFYDHHLVVIDGEECGAQHDLGILVVALREVLHGALHTLWGTYESLAVWIFAQANEHLADEIGVAGGCESGFGNRLFAHVDLSAARFSSAGILERIGRCFLEPYLLQMGVTEATTQ